MQPPGHHGDGKLLGIQAARGIAALLVVAYHAERALSLPQYVGRMPLDGITGFGHAGVDFFFVLSGFIILTVHGVDLGQPGRFRRYAARRVCRIYPPYWIVTALVLMLTFAGHGWDGLPGWQHLGASLLLVPHGDPPVLGVGWTLEFEIVFYLLFGLAILSRRAAVVAVGGWVALSAAALLAGSGSPLGRASMDSYHVLFLIGLAAAWVVQRGTPARSGLIAVLGVAAFLTAGVTEDMGWLSRDGLLPRLAYGLASGAVVVGTVGLERQGRLRVGRVLEVLGAASYSIYLVHLVPLTLTARVLAMAGVVGGMPGWLVMAVCCLVAVAAAVVFYLVVERPVTRAAQRIATRLIEPREQAIRLA